MSYCTIKYVSIFNSFEAGDPWRLLGPPFTLSLYMMISNFRSLEGIIDCIFRQQYFKLYKNVGSLLA